MIEHPSLSWRTQVGILAILGSTTILTGCFGPPYNVSNLNGNYYYKLVEVRNDETAPDIDFCEEYGNAHFDGAGTVEISGTRKCSISGSADESSTQTYSVSPDGTVLVNETGSSNPTRGKLLEGGRMLLIDGTTREPGILIMHGIGIKQ